MSARTPGPSDLTAAQWGNIEHLFPPPEGRAGRPRTDGRKGIVDAIADLARTGAAWPGRPHDFPPWKTASYDFDTWRDAGVRDRIHGTLRVSVRRLPDRDDTPSAGLVGRQSVRATAAGGPKGYGGGDKVPGRKRHRRVDTLGLIWGPAVRPAAPTDRGGAVEVPRRAGAALPRVATVWADSADRAEAWAVWVKAHGRWVIEVVTRRDGAVGFEVQPRPWVVERASGWFGRYRRRSKDYEHNPTSSEAWIDISASHRMSRGMLPDGTGRTTY